MPHFHGQQGDHCISVGHERESLQNKLEIYKIPRGILRWIGLFYQLVLVAFIVVPHLIEI